ERLRARGKRRYRPWRLRSPRYAMYRLRRVGLIFDVLALIGGVGVSALAVWRGHSWLFGLSLSVALLPVAMCWFRSVFADVFAMPTDSRSELKQHLKQALAIFAAGFLVVIVKTLAEPPPKGVTDPVSLLIVVLLAGPLVQHALKARHVFNGAITQLGPPWSRARMPGRVKYVGAPSSRGRAVAKTTS
ncbi:MAG TPA: hypothetical protein VM347_32635, partial [Nonomuraea sp.]|nr:hypothetical protein [Nonomuraea sp.]